MFRPFWVLSVVAANPTCDDESSLLQMQTRPHLATTEDVKARDVTALLSEVRTMAVSMQKERELPIRQCQGGWRTGDGTGGSEHSLGNVASKDACVEAVHGNPDCAGAAGATFEADTSNCFCEMDQQELDDSVGGKENCLFFDEGTRDTNLDFAIEAMDTMVENIFQAMAEEHAAAERIAEESFASVTAALASINDNDADRIRSLEADATTKHEAAQTCASNLAHWTGVQAQACPAWEEHARSLSSCSSSCPCQSASDPEVFYNAYLVWKSIMDNGGGAQIESLRAACQEAIEQVNDLTQNCPALEAEAAEAEALYMSASEEHRASCANFDTAAQHHSSIEADLALTLQQRNSEYCVLQQVQCFLGMIRDASETGEMLSDPVLQCVGWAEADGQAPEVLAGSEASCPLGYAQITDEAECQAYAVDTAEKHWNTATNWGNIHSGCFTHNNNHVWFNRQEGTPHPGYYLVCRVSDSGLVGCPDHFSMSFPQLPASPECVEGHVPPPLACPGSGLLERDRCWYLSEKGDTCGNTCIVQGLDFSWAIGGEESPLIPMLLDHVGRQNLAPQRHAWGPIECLVDNTARFHTANPSSTRAGDAASDWTSRECELACPCAVPQ